ncbi:zinc finger, CCHC-type containing protein [Tanacetum coccineum]
MDDHTDDVPSEIPEPRKEAIDDEIGSIMENNTWVLSDLPPGCKPLGCKWIFKRKMKVDGTIDKFKARLVIQGFRQKEGIDYFDTYAPVARITTIRLLLALAAIHNLVIHQMDVKTTFLNGDLDEEVYMKQPKGFVMSGNEHKVCKLVKSLYGLKQAPKQWHQKFDEVVLSSGFHLNQSDKCVYSKFDSSGKGVIICLYVDDMLIFGTDQNQVDETKKFLSSRFSMKDMGEADVILGIKIKRENKGIVITQSHYIEKILKKFNREDCSPVNTPMDLVEKLKPNTGKPVDQLEYSRAIGCLMYAMTSTRPDIAYVVGRLSTKDYGLSYVGYPLVLEGYSDASWINNIENSSSTSGWVFLLGGGAISWASKKQTCITSSTMEYEFVSLAAAGKEAKWLRNLIYEIPILPKLIAPISIRCDSAPTMARAYSQIYNGKSRHLGVRHSMVRELSKNGVISIEFVRTQNNLADHLMKGLVRDLLEIGTQVLSSRGCDASILLDQTSTIDTEKNAAANANSARGFELGGPTWDVKLGRRDSTTASQATANVTIPSPFMDLPALIKSFEDQGLDEEDLVVLSGAHTLGFAQCRTFRNHIYNDTNIDPAFAGQLRTNCPQAGGDSNLAPLDPTPSSFDTRYFNNLVSRRGVLGSDQALFNGGETDELVSKYNENYEKFFEDFAKSMIKMGNINLLTGNRGQIRENCRRINSQ